MLKNILLLLALVIALAVLFGVVGRSAVEAPFVPPQHSAHFYDTPDIPIDRIEIVVLYFVPNDRAHEAIRNWREVLAGYLVKLSMFHALSFRGTSELSYVFFPEVIVGNADSKAYEITSPSHTDPVSIEPISREISARVLDPSGDLWRYGQSLGVAKGRRIYLIMFEGEGAAGSGDVALISRAYLTNKAYAPYAATFLAHEFYHTLGIPDAYQSSSYVFDDAQQTQIGLLRSQDIMGRVRVPLEYTHLDRETLSHLGL